MKATRNGRSEDPSVFGIVLLDHEFAQVRALIAREVGIQLGDTKRALVVARLGPRLRQLGLRSFGEYYQYVTDPAHGPERVHFIDSLCTNETSFFREAWQFEYLEHHVIPQWKLDALAGRRDRRIRVWSAACSTGEEPYSLAMLLADHLPTSEGWRVAILATDISTKVLRQAEEGVFKLDRSRKAIPPSYLRAYMLKGEGEQEGLMKASPELSAMIAFKPFNLQTPSFPEGPFDLVLCRNVLIYFDAVARSTIIDKLIGALDPTGHLLLGHAEGIVGRGAQLRTVAPSVYTFRNQQRPAAIHREKAFG